MSKSSMRIIRWIAVVAIIGVATTVGLLHWYRHVLSKQAEFMVRAVFDLSEREESPTLADIQKVYGSQLRELEGSTQEDGAYEVLLSNRALVALHLAHYTEMRSYFFVRNGKVLYTRLEYRTTVDNRYGAITSLQLDLCDGCDYFAVDPWNKSSPNLTNGMVMIGHGASTKTKLTALSFDTTCLTNPTGCANIAQLLPAVWEIKPNGRIGCKIQNESGLVDRNEWP